jgi:hypothetical protein
MQNNATEKDTQHRGHCQCCAREQAVLHTGHMAKHGYTVKNGWFQGACSGSEFKPLETDHKRTDAIIEQVLTDCDKLGEQHDKIKEGYIKPATLNVIRAHSFKLVEVAYNDCTVSERNAAVVRMLAQLKQRIRIGNSFVAMLRNAITEYHGKQLIQVKKKDAPEPICAGDNKVSQRGVLSVISLEGGTVRWRDERGFIGKSSTRYWRSLEDREPCDGPTNSQEKVNRARPK